MAFSFDFNATPTTQFFVPETASVSSAPDPTPSSLVADIPGLPSDPNVWTKDDKRNWFQGVGNAYDLDIGSFDEVLTNLEDLDEFLKIDDKTFENADILKNDLFERLAITEPQTAPLQQHSMAALPPQTTSYDGVPVASAAPSSSSFLSALVSLPETTFSSAPVYSAPVSSYSHNSSAPRPEAIMTAPAPEINQYYSPQVQPPFHSEYRQYSTPQPQPQMVATPPAYMSPAAPRTTHFQFPPSGGVPMHSSPSVTPHSAIPPYSPAIQQRQWHHGSLSSLVDSASSSAYTTDDESEFILDPLNPELQSIPTISFSATDGTSNHPQLHNLGPGLVAIPINPKTGKPKRRRRKKIRSSIVPPPLLPNGGANCTLWEFFLELLADPAHYENLIKWTNRAHGEFKIVDSEVVSVIWGLLKNKTTMKYDHMSRSIRYYYGKNILDKVPEKQLVYRFGANSNWLTYEPKSQGLDCNRMPVEPIEICGRVAKPKLFAVAKIGSPLS